MHMFLAAVAVLWRYSTRLNALRHSTKTIRTRNRPINRHKSKEPLSARRKVSMFPCEPIALSDATRLACLRLYTRPTRMSNHHLICGHMHYTKRPPPSPHDAERCSARCEPGLRDFLRKTTRHRATTSEARAALSRVVAMCDTSHDAPLPHDVVRSAVTKATSLLATLETDVAAMHEEISTLRATTMRELFRHCAPVHHPAVTDLSHLAVCPPAGEAIGRRSHE